MRPAAPGHAWALVALTILFSGRVLGQALVAFLDVPFLPPMSAWCSGLLPYPILLPAQLLILAVQLRIDADVCRGRGFAFVARPRAGRAFQWLSYAYALSMAGRWVVTRSHLIPIVFHWVLAAYLWVLGRLWTRRPPGITDERGSQEA